MIQPLHEQKALNVFVTGPLPESVENKLAEFAYIHQRGCPEQMPAAELMKHRPGVDAIISLLGDRISAKVMQSFPDLKLVAVVSIGYDQVDVEYASEHGILVVNAPGVLESSTADLAFGLLIACARRICEADKYVRAKLWTGWKSGLMWGTEISGKTLGLVGMGHIGQCMAKRASAFDLKVIYTRSSPEDELDYRLTKDCGYKRVELDELLIQSDFISIHCPLNAATHHLIGAKEFAKVKPSCILINTARGPVLDQNALVQALRNGQLRAAGLDVFEEEPGIPDELLCMDNVVLTPHIGNASTEARCAMADLAVTGLLSAFAGKPPANLVNRNAWAQFQKRLLEPLTSNLAE